MDTKLPPKRGHSIKIQIRCDMVRPDFLERWPVTLSFSSPPQTPCIGLVRLIPDSKRGKNQFTKLDYGDVLLFDVGGIFFGARVACKNEVGGILVHAFDLFNVLVRPVFLKPNHALRSVTPTKVCPDE
jgi:hypothetical protein